MDATTHAERAARTRFRDVSERVARVVRANVFPLALFAVLRVWTWLWASVTAQFVPLSSEGAKHYLGLEPLRDAFFAPWQRWDTLWYTKIAIEGYAADERVVFAPLYPLLIRLVAPIVGDNAVASAVLVASVAALASFVLLYQLARELFDEDAAKRALLFLAVFPTAFFLFAAYTESLFLALALGAFLCARHGRWGWAGALGGLAAMTRPQGVLFLLPLAVEFAVQYRHKQVPLRMGLTLALVALGGAAHLVGLSIQFGSPAIWLEAQQVWHSAALPWESLGAAWGAVVYAPSLLDAAVSFIDPFFAVVFLGALVWSARRLPLSMTVYMATIVLPPLFVTTTYSVHYPLTAMARYVLVAFPFYLLLGALPKHIWQLPVWAGSFLAQTFLLILFCAWVFVR